MDTRGKDRIQKVYYLSACKPEQNIQKDTMTLLVCLLSFLMSQAEFLYYCIKAGQNEQTKKQTETYPW